MTVNNPIIAKVTSKIRTLGSLYVRISPVIPPDGYAVPNADETAWIYYSQTPQRAGQIVAVEQAGLTSVSLYITVETSTGVFEWKPVA